jgi:hypothetical protein
MFQNEEAILNSIPALQSDPDLLSEVRLAVEEILAMRRTSLFDLLSNPMQKQALIEYGAQDLGPKLEALGVDVEEVDSNGDTVPVALSANNVNVLTGSLMAHLMSLTYSIEQ